jgi:hypothetical protein
LVCPDCGFAPTLILFRYGSGDFGRGVGLKGRDVEEQTWVISVQAEDMPTTKTAVVPEERVRTFPNQMKGAALVARRALLGRRSLRAGAVSVKAGAATGNPLTHVHGLHLLHSSGAACLDVALCGSAPRSPCPRSRRGCKGNGSSQRESVRSGTAGAGPAHRRTLDTSGPPWLGHQHRGAIAEGPLGNTPSHRGDKSLRSMASRTRAGCDAGSGDFNGSRNSKEFIGAT